MSISLDIKHYIKHLNMATTKLIDKYNQGLSELSVNDLSSQSTDYVILANNNNANKPENYKVKCSVFKKWITGDNDIATSLNTINEQIAQLITNYNNLLGRTETLESENEALKSRVDDLEALLSLSSN